jgi:signal peptidase II
MQTTRGTPLNRDYAAARAEVRSRGVRTRWAGALSAVVLAGIDQATKAWALQGLAGGNEVPVIGHTLRLQLVSNSGAAFSLGSGVTWVFTAVTAVVVGLVAVGLTRISSPAWVAAAAMVLGGGAGNLIDRLVRAPGVGVGRVVDFIAYGDWFIGNVADIALVAAVGLVAVLTLRGVPFGPRVGPEGPPGGEAG